jgi:hypothetical protein
MHLFRPVSSIVLRNISRLRLRQTTTAPGASGIMLPEFLIAPLSLSGRPQAGA